MLLASLSDSPFWDLCLLDEAGSRWEGAGCFVFALIVPECHGFGPLPLDTHHLLETVLNYSNLDLSKIGTLKWRLEKRRLDFFL